jgi:hypothetical protein
MSVSLGQAREAIALERTDKERSLFQLRWVNCDRTQIPDPLSKGGDRVE